MSDTVTVTSGTGLLVVSDALLSVAHRLGIATHDLALQHGALVGLIDAWSLLRVPRSQLPPSARSAEQCMAAAAELLAMARDRASTLHSLLRRAIQSYEAADAVATTLWRDIQEQNAWTLGAIARVALGPLIIGAAGSILFTQLRTGLTPTQQLGAVQNLLQRDPQLITNPGFVRGVRGIVSGMDGFGIGFAGLPPQVESVLGAGGLGLLGLRSSASGLAGAGRPLGLFDETPVSVTPARSVAGAAAPTGLTARLARIPDPVHDGGAQIRIDRYSVPGEPDRFDVYLAGTVTFDPKATTEPFDLTSDVVGVAQSSPGAERAVVEAMRKAGVTSTTPVVLNGYSEGGLIATLLASSGKYDVRGLVTFGAPAGQVPVPANIPVLTVRNTDDLVPATGGYDTNPHAVVVARRAFDGHDIPNDLVVPAHQLPAYERTAELADASANPGLADALRPLDRFGAGATATTTMWRAVRLSDPTSGDPATAAERFQ